MGLATIENKADVLMLPFKVQNHFAPVFEKMTNYQQGSKGMLFITDAWYDT
jgi:hypothetical protein